jgi:hypothetical protein
MRFGRVRQAALCGTWYWGRSRQEGFSNSLQPLSSQADAPHRGFIPILDDEASGAVNAGRAEFHNQFLKVLCLDDLLADSEFADDLAVAVGINFLEVIQQTAALADQHQKPTARAMILLVRFEMLGQLSDALSQNGNLYFRTSGVGVMRAKLRDNIGFLNGCQHSVSLLLIFFSIPLFSVYKSLAPFRLPA